MSNPEYIVTTQGITPAGSLVLGYPSLHVYKFDDALHQHDRRTIPEIISAL